MGAREDSDIAREASDALDRMVYVPAGAVKAKVHNHVITLSGTLNWEYQREAARTAMAVLRGVRGVVNTISLKPKAAITPTEAKAKITAALVRKARFDGQHITVHVNGTEIELSGTVASWAEVRQAGSAAWPPGRDQCQEPAPDQLLIFRRGDNWWVLAIQFAGTRRLRRSWRRRHVDGEQQAMPGRRGPE
ncbi:BON domain-containing protein [Micromonospora sp. M12]